MSHATLASVKVRRFAVAVIVAICICAPIVEMFDRWDQTLQDGNDTEEDFAIAALCVGVALAIATTVVVARIRALSLTCPGVVPAPPSPPHLDPWSALTPVRNSSPPTLLRI